VAGVARFEPQEALTDLNIWLALKYRRLEKCAPQQQHIFGDSPALRSRRPKNFRFQSYFAIR